VAGGALAGAREVGKGAARESEPLDAAPSARAEAWPQVLAPLFLAKPELHRHERRIYGEIDGPWSRNSTRVALLSPDAIWDADARRWRLEEINTNGLFQLGADDPEARRSEPKAPRRAPRAHAQASTFHVDEGYTESWLQIAGADGFPGRARYQGRLDALLDGFCAAEGCDAHERAVLERAAHATAHATSGWRPGRARFLNSRRGARVQFPYSRREARRPALSQTGHGRGAAEHSHAGTASGRP